jgi:hypothetical protein
MVQAFGQFAPVRLHRFVERNHLPERTFHRTRANAEPCHPCHATRADELVGKVAKTMTPLANLNIATTLL